jgi:hypothetical protein
MRITRRPHRRPQLAAPPTDARSASAVGSPPRPAPRLPDAGGASSFPAVRRRIRIAGGGA